METTAVNLGGVAGQAPQAGEGAGATPKSPVIKKIVKEGKTVYTVEIDGYFVEARAKTYPTIYLNNYVDWWEINAEYSRGWARVREGGWDDGWARRGSLTNSWIDHVAYVRNRTAKKFINEIREKLEKAEDGTPEVKKVFEEIREFVENIVEEDMAKEDC